MLTFTRILVALLAVLALGGIWYIIEGVRRNRRLANLTDDEEAEISHALSMSTSWHYKRAPEPPPPASEPPPHEPSGT